MRALMKISCLGRKTIIAVGQSWSRFWFQNKPTTPLELTRIGLAAALLLHYSLATPYLFDLWGDDGWMPRELAMRDISPWTQSVFFYFTAPWQLAAFHVLFLLSCAALMIGWQTSWVKWIVLIGQISYHHRDPNFAYGVDQVLACLLLILCVAPIGRAMSIDRVRAVRRAKLKNLAAAPPPYASPWAGACIRLMQIQMAVLFFYSGIAKTGRAWSEGDAAWIVFTSHAYYQPALLDLFAHHYWLANVATYVTLSVQIAFPFLIWQQGTRPYLLAAAILLHSMFAVLMGLFYFSFVVIMGLFSFVCPKWLACLGEAWKRKMGGAICDDKRGPGANVACARRAVS